MSFTTEQFYLSYLILTEPSDSLLSAVNDAHLLSLSLIKQTICPPSQNSQKESQQDWSPSTKYNIMKHNLINQNHSIIRIDDDMTDKLTETLDWN